MTSKCFFLKRVTVFHCIMFNAIICCITLHCTVLQIYNCTILYCVIFVLYCIVLYCIVFVLYCIVLYCICIVLYLYCIVLYCIVLYCIVLYCIVLYCIYHFVFIVATAISLETILTNQRKKWCRTQNTTFSVSRRYG